jgi:predicted nuclease of predicted toxin-antitoxin system
MKFLLDENADLRLAAYLRALGHDTKAIAQDYPNAIPDQDVLAIAQAEGRILITNDRDFGELIVRQGLPHAGVLYFRLNTVELPAFVSRLDAVLHRYSRDLECRRFVVVTDRAIRVRGSSES